MKSLVVDDELVSRMKLKKILEPYGECEAVEDGPAALEAFEEAWREGLPFDLVCLDISMEGMDGTEVLFELRERERKLGVTREKPAKVLMATSHKDRDTVITSIQAGCDGYLVKPFDRGKIRAKLTEIGIKID